MKKSNYIKYGFIVAAMLISGNVRAACNPNLVSVADCLKNAIAGLVDERIPTVQRLTPNQVELAIDEILTAANEEVFFNQTSAEAYRKLLMKSGNWVADDLVAYYTAAQEALEKLSAENFGGKGATFLENANLFKGLAKSRANVYGFLVEYIKPQRALDTIDDIMRAAIAELRTNGYWGLRTTFADYGATVLEVLGKVVIR